MIIDFHTHIFPEKVADKALLFISNGAKIKPFANGTLDKLKKSMKLSGVTHSVICNIATNPNQVLNIYEWSDLIKSDEIIPLMSIHPESNNKSKLVKMFKESGYQGFKMHPDYQNFYIDDRDMYEFYEAVISEDMFILFHAGVDLSLKPPFHATPKRLKNLLKDLPDLKIIAAHMGSFKMYDEVEKYLLGKNIFLDTAYCLDKMPGSLLKKFFSKHPIERFLFASDSPWCDQKQYVDFFTSLPFLNDDEKEKVLCLNAKDYLLKF